MAAEALGTAFLVATVVGSGVMAETLTKDTALALLGNTIPTGAILVVLIAILGPISGAHFNPAVSLVFALRRELSPRDASLYIVAQIIGGVAGTFAAHLMFALPLIETSLKARTGAFAMVRRVGGDIRAHPHDPCRNPIRPRLSPMARRPLHHRRLLVYGLDLVRQSGRGDRAFADQHLFRHPAGRSAGVHRRAVVLSGLWPRRHHLAVAWGDRNFEREGGAMTVTIYHNPNCGTSRNVLAMIRQSGEEPVVIEYLKNPPNRERLKELIEAMGMPARALLREKGTPYAELGLADPKWSDDQLLDFMLQHPILINRPIVETPKGVKLCRPSETVLDLLPNPDIGRFVKEDGEVVKTSPAPRPKGKRKVRKGRKAGLVGSRLVRPERAR
jgi:arsenate reductase